MQAELNTSSLTTYCTDFRYSIAKTWLAHSKNNNILFIYYILVKQEKKKSQLIMF